MDEITLINEILNLSDQINLRLGTLVTILEAKDRTQNLYMTRKEAATFLGVSVRQLDRYCHRGYIQKDDLNGQVRIRRSELVRFWGCCLEGESVATLFSENELLLRRVGYQKH